ncbi:MAG: S8 family serine peptidase [Phycisphaeraceae bacterium]
MRAERRQLILGWGLVATVLAGVWSLSLVSSSRPANTWAVAPAPAPGADAVPEAVPAAADPQTRPSEPPPSVPPPPPKPQPTLRDRIGIVAIDARLGDKAPTGRGVPFGHVEGGPGDYTPDLKATRYAGVKMHPLSGTSKTNGHADSTARIIYGAAGLASGVSDVHFYTTHDFMGPRCLLLGANRPPQPNGRRIFTHSWIGGQGGYVEQVLRRVDFLVDHHDVLFVVGVNNGKDKPVPELLGSGYNSIAVGNTNGNSSGGYTVYDEPGRCKPDIVAPQTLTSFSTPVVAAVCARLLETADRMDDSSPDAGRSEVIRAVLYAGAEKPAGWQSAAGKPLDEHLGAGSVRYDHSYDILAAGPNPPGNLTSRYGWDFQSLGLDAAHDYTFDSPAELVEVSLMLVWNRHIDGRMLKDLFTQEQRWTSTPSLAELHLKLYRRDADGKEEPIAVSASAVDNLQHIYRAQLPAGRYRIQVARVDKLGGEWDYALAWRMNEAPAP